jgi:hypothetical protein
MIKHTLPELEKHDGVIVVRDMLGTKSRYIAQLYQQADHVVYASSSEGGAQAALAYTAKKLGKKCTVFGPARANLHPRQLEVINLGGGLVPVRPGHLNVLQSRAHDFARRNGAMLAPFGMAVPEAIDVIADTASRLKVRPNIVFCAAGSGTLARGLQQAWPTAELHYVQVGADVDVPGAVKHTVNLKYQQAAPASWAPFDCCPHYEAKAFHVMKLWLAVNRGVKGNVLFWSPMTSAKA